jgi:hypothetical protein
MGNAQEICVKVLDTASGEFGATTAVTSNDVIDAIPAVTAYNGAAYIAWNRISGSVLDDNSENYICYVSFANGSVGEEHVKSCGTMSVSEITAMTTGAGPVAAYTLFDSSEGISAAQKAYTLSMTDATADAVLIGGDDAVSVSGAYSATLNGAATLFWMQDGNILYRTGEANAPQKVFAQDGYKMDGFTVADGGSKTYLIWRSTDVTGEVVEGEVPQSTAVLYAVCYQDGAWGKPYLLTDCECDMVQISVTGVRKAGEHHLLNARNPVWIFSFTI